MNFIAQKYYWVRYFLIIFYVNAYFFDTKSSIQYQINWLIDYLFSRLNIIHVNFLFCFAFLFEFSKRWLLFNV